MSTNANDIPGAPGFSMPDGLSPEERDAFLMRLRFGPSLFKSGQNFSSAGGEDNTTPPPTSNAQPGVMSPAVMQGFLQMANNRQDPGNKTHSEQMLQKILGPGQNASGATPEEAQPTSEEEYQKLYPSNVYDLPSDGTAYERYAQQLHSSRAYEDQQGKQKVAEENAQNNADVKQAQADKASAQADLTRAQTENPEKFGRAGSGGVGSRIQQGIGSSIASDLLAAAQRKAGGTLPAGPRVATVLPQGASPSSQPTPIPPKGLSAQGLRAWYQARGLKPQQES